MSSVTLIAFCVLLVLTGQALAQNATVDQALEWANIQYQKVAIDTREKLPATAEAQRDGEDLLDSFKTGLSHCEAELRTSRNVDLHKVCVNSLMAGVYASLGQLAGEHWAIYGATSGASRIGLFW